MIIDRLAVRGFLFQLVIVWANNVQLGKKGCNNTGRAVQNNKSETELIDNKREGSIYPLCKHGYSIYSVYYTHKDKMVEYFDWLFDVGPYIYLYNLNHFFFLFFVFYYFVPYIYSNDEVATFSGCFFFILQAIFLCRKKENKLLDHPLIPTSRNHPQYIFSLRYFNFLFFNWRFF